MERVEKSIEVNCPIDVVYNQWTQFEDFPQFMSGVKEVQQLDDTHLRWHAEVWGKEKEWDAEITADVLTEFQSWLYHQPTPKGAARGVANQNRINDSR